VIPTAAPSAISVPIATSFLSVVPSAIPSTVSVPSIISVPSAISVPSVLSAASVSASIVTAGEGEAVGIVVVGRVVDAVWIVAVRGNVSWDADRRAPSGVGVFWTLIAEFVLRGASDDAVLDADVRELIFVAFVAELASEVALAVGFSGQTLLETAEGIEILVALIAEPLQRRIPRHADLVAERGIQSVRTAIAELRLRLQRKRRRRTRDPDSQYEI